MSSPAASMHAAAVKRAALRGGVNVLAGLALGSSLLLHQHAASAAEPGESPQNQLGLTVGVPFFDNELLHGDMNVDLRYGHKLSWLVPYVSGGFRQTRMDPARIPEEAKRKKLQAWHITAGLRLELPAVEGKLYPFVGIAGELSYWGHTADTTSYCHEAFYPDAWRCYQPFDWKSGGGVKQQVGLLYKPEPSLAIELWVERATVHAPGMFTRLVSIVSPGVGMAWHF
jgi:hypothetical protein